MNSAPSTEQVYQGVYAFYNNSNTLEQQKASQWLNELQKSVYSWKIADELLQQKRDLQSCYFAAQTIRSKIQNSFHELPATAHESLRESLMSYISQITAETDAVIVTQLCLALSDLALLMSTWRNPVMSLLERFSASQDNSWPLLVILTLLPEEINSRYLRLGKNRRTEIHAELKKDSRTVLEYLLACLQTGGHEPATQMRTIKCFTSWLSIHAIELCDIRENIIVGLSFRLLLANETSVQLHEVAANFVCTLLQCFETNNTAPELEAQIFTAITTLEEAYNMSVAQEAIDKTVNYCRIFTVLGETFLERMLNNTTDFSPHYSIKALDLVLNCVGHYDYEVAEITFNLWFRLSEDLYNRCNDSLTDHFKPHIERLIGALVRHSQMEPDHEGLIEEGDLFMDFRRKVCELTKDVVFIVGSSHCFKQMFFSLQGPNVTWESSEAALFIMSAVAKNILVDENEVVPKVVEAILNLPENTHIAVRYTSVVLLGELCEWIERHPESLQAVLNFLLYSLQQKSGLPAAAATSLPSICSACRDHMTCHASGLLQIANSLDSFELSNDSAICLLKGICIVLSRLPSAEMTKAVKEICGHQLTPLCQLLECDVKAERGKSSDPVFWIDRLAAIMRHSNPILRMNETHPMLSILEEIWPVMSNVFVKYQADLRIMERTCRFVRYAIRCVGKQATPILEPLVKQMVHLYAMYQHTCFLYLGSILVDEFAKNSSCTKGLLDMLQTFIEPTFQLLQVENGLRNHPDTVDDFFRLCSRYLLRSPVEFLQSPMITPIIQCALLACSLDHHDANISVMKFFLNLLHCGREEEDEVMQLLLHDIVAANGEALMMNLVHASVFCLQSHRLSDVADVMVELKVVDEERFSLFLRSALNALPKKNSGGCITMTEAQLKVSHQLITGSETPKAVTHALKDFVKLYR
ncbi:transportin-3 [Phlebotomus argentipes]|uniref:transportin-3 n=1 Tax=Phlebotomus argentipes TaxID=94469 RepID=UPI00289354AA|nr:transportin-3 [Phlebotomus argentipes]